MSGSVAVTNETDLALAEEVLGRLVGEVLAAEGADGDVGLAFVDEPTIAELNERYRAVAGPTDVLSFPYRVEGEDWPEAGEEGVELGEVVVCPSVARANAEAEEVAFSEELGRLVVHGVLHLLGYDHEVDQGEMIARQEDLLRAQAPLLPGLLSIA